MEQNMTDDEILDEYITNKSYDFLDYQAMLSNKKYVRNSIGFQQHLATKRLKELLDKISKELGFVRLYLWLMSKITK
jgi:hypothetical protein